MERNEAIEVWARLAAHGTVPTEITRAAHVLPSYTAGIGPWIDRLSIRYLRGTDVQPGVMPERKHTSSWFWRPTAAERPTSC